MHRLRLRRRDKPGQRRQRAADPPDMMAMMHRRPDAASQPHGADLEPPVAGRQIMQHDPALGAGGDPPVAFGAEGGDPPAADPRVGFKAPGQMPVAAQPAIAVALDHRQRNAARGRKRGPEINPAGGRRRQRRRGAMIDSVIFARVMMKRRDLDHRIGDLAHRNHPPFLRRRVTVPARRIADRHRRAHRHILRHALWRAH